ncbi:MAG: YceI family protein [Bryobacteraceae bacterium]|nr:YceI family protein [Bryobacteraceae bacterium]
MTYNNLNRQSLMCAFFLVLTASGQAELQTYKITPAPTGKMELTVVKTGLMSGKKHLFTFEQYDGILMFDRLHPNESRIRFSIDARSAACHDSWVSAKDLRKIHEFALNDMLATGKFEKIVFASTSVKSIGGGQYEVTGDLTIRAVSKPATVLLTMAEKPDGLVFEGTSHIKLTDYGLKPPTAALGAVGTKNEISLSFAFTASGTAKHLASVR